MILGDDMTQIYPGIATVQVGLAMLHLTKEIWEWESGEAVGWISLGTDHGKSDSIQKVVAKNAWNNPL